MDSINYLRNYLQDLDYNASNGLHSLNNGTCGTPYFETEKAASDYIEGLRDYVEMLQWNESFEAKPEGE